MEEILDAIRMRDRAMQKQREQELFRRLGIGFEEELGRWFFSVNYWDARIDRLYGRWFS